ncbi:MAG: 50S ribosomal protein L6, partial [Oscillospiraceae bacterium]|nr:50S ribosomal protein L6 [Oscillospiraceae bacterium]
MSRIGRMPIVVPAGVEVTVEPGNRVTVKGPKGALTQVLHPEMILERADNVYHVKRPSEAKRHKALHGLTRALLNNMVTGVTVGFRKDLEINGVGYRAQKQGKQLIMNLGYSHQVIVEEIDGVSIEVPAPNRVVISGCDR